MSACPRAPRRQRAFLGTFADLTRAAALRAAGAAEVPEDEIFGTEGFDPSTGVAELSPDCVKLAKEASTCAEDKCAAALSAYLKKCPFKN